MKRTAIIAACGGALAAGAVEPWTAGELGRFARDLGDYVIAHHIRRDTNSPLCGMVYRWYRPADGRWVLDPAGNMLSDGAWFTDALALYDRATRDSWALTVLRKYTLPFYLRVLTRSDQFFATSTGICPFWWDDGASVSLAGGSPLTGFAARPRLTSNTLAEDVAAMLMTASHHVDSTDMALAAAYLLHGDRALYENETEPITLGIAAAVICGDMDTRVRWLPRRRWRAYDGPFGPAHAALILGRKTTLDDLCAEARREYRAAVAAQPWQPLDEAFARNFLYSTLSALRLVELWHDTGRQPGLGLPERQPPVAGAKFDRLQSDRREIIYGPRAGPALLCNAAIALQLLTAFPGAWEHGWRARAPEAIRVSENHAPVPSDTGAFVELAWRPAGLLIRARGPRTMTFAPQPPAAGRPATVTLDASGRVAAATDEGVALLAVASPQPDGRTEIEVPFTVAKAQKPWLNATEESLWTVSVDGGAPRRLVFLSTSAALRARLAIEVAEGLRFWQRLYRERGCLPAALIHGSNKPCPGSELSDAGGYAFLLGAIAEYACWLKGERDWELALKCRPGP